MCAYTPKRKQVHQFKEIARKDPYRSKAKPKGILRCPECKSVSIRGRWLSSKNESVPPSLHITGEMQCPACRQREDHFAMGVIELHGSTWQANKNKVMKMIRNTEQISRKRNDQERILWTQLAGNVTKIYVSLPELARHVGRELEKSFQGKTKYSRSTQEPYLRVRWQSDLPHMKHRPGSSTKPGTELLHKSKEFRSRSRKINRGSRQGQ